ncbi:NAD-dependent epimerase/dehydratase family protein [Pedobacter cryophilus]|uniref:NAD(P)-dependent oxidoreductase n=1 Tax=Pedobacter cryophilus TaxID=2571271 RepID=A0A4U1C7R8_9SPHI|nr:NAD(P)-dependent oxidoreductase [Pedobacter cryophilus]TKC00457.1 NAD(P)-dependent oxidoreductase [Pedobacter cryophilus]
MNKIVLLGANGYIGQHLASKLINENCLELYLFDIQEKSVNNFPNYYQLNLLEDIPEEYKEIIISANYIFHFSGITGTLKSIEYNRTYINVNEIGLLNILDIIRKIDGIKPKIIFPSTRLIYKGAKNTLLREDAEKEFKTIYSVNKFACEQYLEIYKSLYNITYCILRICVPYGNMLESNLSFGTISHFINKAKSKENIIIYGDGSLKRTFTHIDDLTNLIIKGGLSKKTDNQTFNIASNNHLTLLEVAQPIATKYNVKIELKEFPEQDLIIESGDTIFDGRKLKDILFYEYKHNFNDWIKNLKTV